MTFQDGQLNSMTFQAWKMKLFNFITFQVFHDLCELCASNLFLIALCCVRLCFTILHYNIIILS